MAPSRSGGPVATRKKLLTAARREFAKNGLAGARVDEIADRAGVNKQLVYHYFGDKDALYLAVLEWVYEEIRTQEKKLNLEGLPPERAIRKLIESSFDHLALHPDFIVLLNDENRNGARHVRASLKIEDMHSPLVSLVSKILKEGVQAGTFRKGVNPVQSRYLDRGPELFLLLEHADPVGDLREGPVEHHGEARPPQACGRPGAAGTAAVRQAHRHCEEQRDDSSHGLRGGSTFTSPRLRQGCPGKITRRRTPVDRERTWALACWD